MSISSLERARLLLRLAYAGMRGERGDELVDDIARRLDAMCIEITHTIEADTTAVEDEL